MFESFEGFAADALGRGVGVGEVGVGFFEVFEFAEEDVVFGVGDFGLGLGVVEPVVAVEFLGEEGDASGGVVRGLGEEVFHGGIMGKKSEVGSRKLGGLRGQHTECAGSFTPRGGGGGGRGGCQ